MVDPVNGLGSIQSVLANKNGATAESRKSEKAAEGRAVTDEVIISGDALTLQQAEKTLFDTRKQLENSDRPLGLNPDFIREQLA